MSLRTSKIFGSRGPSQTEEPNKKFIFLFEGEKTEKQYFEGLFNSREEFGIQELLDIKTLEREDGSRSNQKKIVEELHNSIQAVIELKGNKEQFLLEVEKIFEKLGIPNYDGIKARIGHVLSGSNIEENLDELIQDIAIMKIESKELEDFINQLSDLRDLLEFEKEYDTVCIILDRDKHSFKEWQYDEVLEICSQNNYTLGITNPCFEFWLLLHLSDCTEHNIESIKENKRINKSRKYVEGLLLEEIGSYKKNKLKFNIFKPGIRDAIRREKEFCEDVTRLKDEVGSNIGVIISELL
ncbi:RloB family protein [Bacillus sp. SCS-153A]|uniref:RloB family protein n=1 Tax=Rossellomorea sedimentorum TaxID=3115294 RepID=UPI003905B080